MQDSCSPITGLLPVTRKCVDQGEKRLKQKVFTDSMVYCPFYIMGGVFQRILLNKERDLSIIMETPLLTIREVAHMFHVHVNTVRNWINRGLIKSYKIGMRGDLRFKKEEVEELFNKIIKNETDENASPEND